MKRRKRNERLVAIHALIENLARLERNTVPNLLAEMAQEYGYTLAVDEGQAPGSQRGVVLDAEQAEGVAQLLETFVLDDGPREDPLYQLAADVVGVIHEADRVRLVPLLVSDTELGDLIAALLQESEAFSHERGDRSQSDRLGRLATRLGVASESTREYLDKRMEDGY